MSARCKVGAPSAARSRAGATTYLVAAVQGPTCGVSLQLPRQQHRKGANESGPRSHGRSGTRDRSSSACASTTFWHNLNLRAPHSLLYRIQSKPRLERGRSALLPPYNRPVTRISRAHPTIHSQRYYHNVTPSSPAYPPLPLFPASTQARRRSSDTRKRERPTPSRASPPPTSPAAGDAPRSPLDAPSASVAPPFLKLRLPALRPQGRRVGRHGRRQGASPHTSSFPALS